MVQSDCTRATGSTDLDLLLGGSRWLTGSLQVPYNIALHRGRDRLNRVVWNGDYESAKERARERLAEQKEATRVTVSDSAQDRLLFSLVR